MSIPINLPPPPAELPNENRQVVEQSWFDKMLQNKDESPEQVNALKAYHDRLLTPQEAAYAITRLVTNSPLPDSPFQEADYYLMYLLANALNDWPLARTPDLIALLSAFKNLPDGPHRGEVMTRNGQPLAWASIPYIESIWTHDFCWEVHGDIKKRYTKIPARRDYEIAVYVKRQDIMAQLTAAGFIYFKRAYWYMIGTLEQKLDFNDSVPQYRKVVLELNIPAAARWIIATGKRIYEGAIKEETADYDTTNDTTMAVQYGHMCKERWNLWERRFAEFADGAHGDNEMIKREAKTAVEHMKAVVEAYERQG